MSQNLNSSTLRPYFCLSRETNKKELVQDWLPHQSVDYQDLELLNLSLIFWSMSEAYLANSFTLPMIFL
jgi:hypothetical protein